jgi:hypothetical protein
VESRTNDDVFSTQPKEILQKIGEEPSGIINLSNLSRAPYTLFSNSNERRLALDCLRQLLSHSALGKWDDAEGMWKLFPDLLTCRGTIYHPNPPKITPRMNPGRYIFVDHTAWQIALRNEEWEIAAAMEEHMAEEEKQAQFAQVFPDGEIKCHLDLEEATSLLKAVLEAVRKDETFSEFYPFRAEEDIMNPSTRDAVKNLYDYVKPNPKQQTGLVFNPDIYLEALRLYDDNKHLFRRWQQSNFWCIRIEEYLAYLLGTGHLRHHAHGVKRKGKAVGCKVSDGSSYFAFHRSSESVPGYHFHVDTEFGDRTARDRTSPRSTIFRDLCWETRARTDFMQKYSPQQKTKSCL